MSEVCGGKFFPSSSHKSLEVSVIVEVRWEAPKAGVGLRTRVRKSHVVYLFPRDCWDNTVSAKDIVNSCKYTVERGIECEFPVYGVE